MWRGMTDIIDELIKNAVAWVRIILYVIFMLAVSLSLLLLLKFI